MAGDDSPARRARQSARALALAEKIEKMSAPLRRAARAAEKAARASEERDEAIRAAHAGGETLRAIAEATGLSHQRVHQIVQKG